MSRPSKYSGIVVNLLIAVAISLVVNFSYVLLMLVDLNSDSQPRPSDQRAVERPDEGVLSVHPDGYGYLVYENGDSVYVPTRRMRWLEIAPGDRIVADLMPPRSEKAHPMLAEIRTRNGAEFDYSKLYNGPSKMTELLLQLFYYLVVSFVMLSILTSVRRNYSMSRFVRRCLWCCVAAAALYCVAPVTEWHTGRIGLNFMSGRMFDYMLLLKCSFAVVASMLYGRIYVLISQRQAVVGERQVAVRVLGREAAACAVHQHLHLERGARVGHVVHHVGDVAERCGDDRLDGRAVQAVLQVVLLEHEGGRHHDRAELRERRGHEPELVVAAQDDHDVVAAADAGVRQVVRGLVRPLLHVGEREHVLLALGVAPHHGATVGVGKRDVVDHVVAEVEALGAFDGEIGQQAFLVVGLFDEAEVDVSHGCSLPWRQCGGQPAARRIRSSMRRRLT